jgi:hypothetical protein
MKNLRCRALIENLIITPLYWNIKQGSIWEVLFGELALLLSSDMVYNEERSLRR